MRLNAKALSRAAEQAAEDTASFLTLSLQTSAQNAGWAGASRAVSVHWNGKSYEVKTQPEALEQVKALEYGTGDTQPSAVLRKFATRTDEASKFFAGRMKQISKGGRK